MRARAKFELDTIHDNSSDCTVVRPGWVYGNNFGHYLDSWFQTNSNGELEFTGNQERRWGWVHVEDLADAYVKIVNATSSSVAGQLFDICDDSRVTYHQIRTALARVAGINAKVVIKPLPDTAIENAESVPSAKKIRNALGWHPKHGSILDDVDLYYLGFKAYRAKL